MLAAAGLVMGFLAGGGAGADELPPGFEQTAAPARVAGAQTTAARTVKLGLNKSVVVDLPRDARDVLVSNPVIADAVMRTPRRIYLTGIAVGQTNIIIFDRAGQQIVSLELAVERDGRTLEQMLRRLIPGSDISVEMVTDNIVLSGTVRNSADANRAQDIANIFVNGGAQGQSSSSSGSAATIGGASISISGATQQAPTSSVVNLLSIQGEDQVQIRVTVAEVQRNIVKQLGIDLNGQFQIGSLGGTFETDNPFAVANKAASDSNLGITLGSGDNTVTATLRTLEQTGMVHTLAEPTLTAISGESATFLAGGEFPIPTARDQDGNITVTYKPFGVGLSFTPVVLSAGRISLHVKTEVSDLSSENAIALSGISLPSIIVRRSESTLELPSGGSMVMAGLIQDSTRQAIAGVPGLKNLPVLGALFRSRDFKRNETELVILITPYLVKPVARTALASPDQGFAPASDRAGNLLGQINRVYGTNGGAPKGTYEGRYGYIYE
jgi:pilus assembly protein CpaC